MTKNKILSILFFLAVLAASLWQLARNAAPPTLQSGGYKTTIYKSSIVISHPAAPGVYNTILPYDESIIFSDGSMQKIRTPQADIKENQRVNHLVTRKISQIENWFLGNIYKQLRTELINKKGYKTIYRAKDRGNKIEIERTIKAPQTNKKTMIGIEEALIFDPQSYVLVDGERLNKTDQENSNRVSIEQANNLKIVHPQTPEALQLQIENANTITIDFEYQLITIQKYVDPSSGIIRDKQIIEVVSFN